jgi:hypothetical protein
MVIVGCVGKQGQSNRVIQWTISFFLNEEQTINRQLSKWSTGLDINLLDINLLDKTYWTLTYWTITYWTITYWTITYWTLTYWTITYWTITCS